MIVNGIPKTRLEISDRGLQYGDGVFTTIAIVAGIPELWLAHLQRLKHSCSRLAIQFDAWTDLENIVKDHASQHSNVVMKIIITRGSGGRGYSPNGAELPNYIITIHPWPSHYSSFQKDGISLGLSTIALARQPLLAGLKHLNRLEQVLIKQELELSAFDDCIVCDSEGYIVESSAGNVFWRDKNAWYTPKLDQAGVAGVMRNHVMGVLGKNDVEIHEVITTIDSLKNAKDVFICNSLMKVVPVNNLSVTGDTGAYQFSNRHLNELTALVESSLC